MQPAALHFDSETHRPVVCASVHSTQKDMPNTLFEPLTTEDDSDELMEVPKVASLWQMKTDAQLAAIPNWQERMQW
jgi:hypothetical protein